MRKVKSSAIVVVAMNAACAALATTSIGQEYEKGDQVVALRDAEMKVGNTTVAWVSQNEKLVVEHVDGEWLWVRNRGMAGWVHSNHLARSVFYIRVAKLELLESPDDGASKTKHILKLDAAVVPLGKWEDWIYVRAVGHKKSTGWLRYHLLSQIRPNENEKSSRCSYISRIAIEKDTIVTGRGVSAQITIEPDGVGGFRGAARPALTDGMCYAFTSQDSRLPETPGFRPVLEQIYIFKKGVLKPCGGKLMPSDVILADARIPDKEIALENRTGVAWKSSALEMFNALFQERTN